MEIAGNNNGQNDWLNISGTATLAGTLDLSLGFAFNPPAGQPATWDVISSSMRLGQFNAVNLPPGNWSVIYDPTSVVAKWGG